MEITLTTIDDNGKRVPVNQPATISLDKLSFNCKATECLKQKLLYLVTTRDRQTVNELVTLSPNFSSKERGYRYVVDVLFRGEIYVHLAFCPTMNVMSDDHVKVKLRNHVLYERIWVENVTEILKSLNLECHTITELHIALDSSGVVDRFLNLYYSPELQLVRAGLFGKLNKEKKLTARNGFHFNKRVSDLYIAFYDKSLDYLEKPYIKAFHELNDVRNNVQRIEIRIRKISTLKMTGFDWQDLGSRELLTQIFRSEFESRIVFNDMSKVDRDNSRNKRYAKLLPIDFPSPKSEIKSIPKNNPGIENMKAIKNTVRNIYTQLERNPSEHNLLTLQEMINDHGLEAWYTKASRRWRTSPTVNIPKPNKTGWAQKLLSKFVILELQEWRKDNISNEFLIENKAA